jgi:hypothetical protein
MNRKSPIGICLQRYLLVTCSLVLSIVVAVTNLSCRNNQEIYSRVNGTWSIDSIGERNSQRYEGSGPYQTNAIILEENGDAHFPRTRKIFQTDGTWKIVIRHDSAFLSVNVDRPDFNGLIPILFNPGDSSHMTITVGDVQLICTKMPQ